MIGLIFVLCAVVRDAQVGGIVFRNEAKTAADAEPLVELVTSTSLHVETALAVPFAVPHGFFNLHVVGGTAEHKAYIPALGFVVADILFGDDMVAYILAFVRLFVKLYLLAVGSVDSDTVFFDLIAVQKHAGRGLNAFHQIRHQERLVLLGVNQSGGHPA